jgi:hypothetical protein
MDLSPDNVLLDKEFVSQEEVRLVLGMCVCFCIIHIPCIPLDFSELTHTAWRRMAARCLQELPVWQPCQAP